MARKVIWTNAAWADLGEVADYIAADSPRYAAAYVRDVRSAARSLRQFAERGRVVPEFEDPSLRELIVHNHRLSYRVDRTTVTLLGLIHGARDLARLWRDEERD